MALNVEDYIRHEPTEDCDGLPVAYHLQNIDGMLPYTEVTTIIKGNGKCSECGIYLCSCEYAYGHDCEE